MGTLQTSCVHHEGNQARDQRNHRACSKYGFSRRRYDIMSLRHFRV
ncbi:hypothetical protein HU200_043664 [Digitaria exilis]|uniref:Uncharacterized protein n=1 Tax=Digitaria exilis TaxID=1010633 RepID=A0A835EDN0_9POAL|nr:hypothetical protein HU200_043664 [Digitaria exilis]